jgi:hypothetical protein
MNIKSIAFSYITALLVAGCTSQEDNWEVKRQAAVNRPRTLVYNTDGCDMLYWPSNLPITVENFTGRRLKDTLGTCINTVSYCPQSAGFGHFICAKAGEPLTGTVPHPNGGCYNSFTKFVEIGTDALKMASDFCATNKLEVFVSVRVNDQHDASSKPGKLSALFPPFKQQHPECLMGTLEKGSQSDGLFKGYAGWSCVNFDCELVRERMKKFVRELVANYDVDGIEYDFNRHFMLFKSVAMGGVASDSEIAKMTQLMRDLKAITEEVGRKKNRPIVIAMRAPDSVEYCRAVGVDLKGWFSEKLVDIWIGAGYFRLNHWKVSADLAHSYGVKFYASLDESRIARGASRKKLPILPGRMTREFYAARFADAIDSGCDGVYVFNIENAFMHKVCKMNPKDVSKEGKIRFAMNRGSGGYRPWRWLKDSAHFCNLSKIDPGEPLAVNPGETKTFDMYIGDDTSALKASDVIAKVLTNLKEEKLNLVCNGVSIAPKSVKDGVCTYNVDPASLKRGLNAFSVTFPKSAPKRTTFNDFSLSFTAPLH